MNKVIFNNVSNPRGSQLSHKLFQISFIYSSNIMLLETCFLSFSLVFLFS